MSTVTLLVISIAIKVFFFFLYHPPSIASNLTGHLFSPSAIIFIAGGSSGVQPRMGHFVTFLLLEQISAILLLLLLAMQVIHYLLSAITIAIAIVLLNCTL